MPPTKILSYDLLKRGRHIPQYILFDSDHVIGHVEVDVMTKVTGRLNFS